MTTALTETMARAEADAMTETMARAEADAMTETMARAEADAMSGRTGRLPVAPAAPDSLAFRFVAAAEAVGSVPEGTTLRWQAGRWIESGTPG